MTMHLSQGSGYTKQKPTGVDMTLNKPTTRMLVNPQSLEGQENRLHRANPRARQCHHLKGLLLLGTRRATVPSTRLDRTLRGESLVYNPSCSGAPPAPMYSCHLFPCPLAHRLEPPATLSCSLSAHAWGGSAAWP